MRRPVGYLKLTVTLTYCASGRGLEVKADGDKEHGFCSSSHCADGRQRGYVTLFLMVQIVVSAFRSRSVASCMK